MASGLRPHVVLVVADDMGYSDLGCYGGEVATPTLDRLGRAGVRLSRFYNTARCSPSRASLLTGLHPHQTGLGILTNDDRPQGYPGSLNRRCVTLAEMLRQAGYATCLSGKWHLASEVWTPSDAWPTRRGFDRFFGTLSGCGSFYRPTTLMRMEDNAEREAAAPGFFYTDAITREAEAFVRAQGSREPGRPFFLYTAYTAPHWPLHALPDDIARYRGVFDAGWDELRETRLRRLVAEGIMPAGTTLSDRDPGQPAWGDAPHPAWQLARMQAYAAQIDRMDRGIGRIVAALAETGALENTLFLFLSDNGASAEPLPIGDGESFRRRRGIVPPATWSGAPLRIGNSPDIEPGPEDTYASYGRAWANLSNTPFRFYKRWVHEGGISTPLIVHWPAGGLGPRIVDDAFQLIDVVPTVLEATGAEYPASYASHDPLPLEGRSMLPALRGERVEPGTLYWEHIGNTAIRRGRFKLVREHGQPWELYDIDTDRAELANVAASHPDVVAELATAWQAWAIRVGVIPWERVQEIYRREGKGDPAA
jgi:arylsulfatase A-like enzyme